MSRTVILVTLDVNEPSAAQVRTALLEDELLRDTVELRFARGEAIAAEIGEAEVAFCGHLTEEQIAAAPNLRWIAFWSAGLDGKITPQIQSRGLWITNSSGVHGPNIAEHVMAWMLMFTRQMHLHLRAQMTGEWRDDCPGLAELTGQTLGIVGLGRIGEALTLRAKAFGMRVLAVKRNPQSRYEAAVVPDALYGPDALPSLLAESDHVCIALPYTPATHQLFDAALLAHLKPTAYLYNIARGKIVDEAALLAALEAGKLAGAGLDVFETEPLPAESPLWQKENVLITPHVAGQTPLYFQRGAALFATNLRRYLTGEPLLNRYDPTHDY